jgi:hypothetical protein
LRAQRGNLILCNDESFRVLYTSKNEDRSCFPTTSKSYSCDAADRSEVAAVTALGYGLTGEWALFGILPYRDISLDMTPGGERANRSSSSGFGDLSLSARYTAYQNNRRGRTFRIAPFAGIEAPIGTDNAYDALGQLPPAVQTGSGSWDYFGGLVLIYQTLQYQLSASSDTGSTPKPTALKREMSPVWMALCNT